MNENINDLLISDEEILKLYDAVLYNELTSGVYYCYGYCRCSDGITDGISHLYNGNNNQGIYETRFDAAICYGHAYGGYQWYGYFPCVNSYTAKSYWTRCTHN